MALIADATDGSVTPNDFFALDTKPRNQRRAA
jgi:hypothetical protein